MKVEQYVKSKWLSVSVCLLGFALIIASAVYYLSAISPGSNEKVAALIPIRNISGFLNVSGIIALVIGFAWWERRFANRSIRAIKTVLLSMGLSFVCAMWLFGCLSCIGMGLGDPSEYPYAFPFYRTMCLDGFCGIAGFGAYWIYRRDDAPAKVFWRIIGIAVVLFPLSWRALLLAENLAEKLFL